jgi:hypothetical protein
MSGQEYMSEEMLLAIRARLEEPPPLIALAERKASQTALTEYLTRLQGDRIALVDEIDRLRSELGYSADFRVEVMPSEDTVICLRLFGELDITTMAIFESAVETALAKKPKVLHFDLTTAQFVSIQGFVTIGRCSLTTDRVTVLSETDLASRILCICGYTSVKFE